MTSYISSFNKLLICNAVLLVLIAELLAFLMYPSTRGIDYEMRDAIQKQRPDIVFVGSSPLGNDIKSAGLSKELDVLLRKKYKVYRYHSTSVAGSLLWYLLLRNQIAEAGCQTRAVGIAVTDNYLTNWGLKDTELHVERQLKGKEDLLLLQRHTKGVLVMHDGLLDYFGTFRAAQKISKDVKAFFVDFLLERMRLPKAEQVLNKKFNLKAFNMVDAFSVPYRMAYDFDIVLKESYLQEIIALKNQYKINLFVVILPTWPIEQGVDYERKKAYYDRLKNYLEVNGVGFISFWDNPEFDHSEMFIDRNHLGNPMLLHRMLAAELVAKGIVQ